MPEMEEEKGGRGKQKGRNPSSPNIDRTHCSGKGKGRKGGGEKKGEKGSKWEIMMEEKSLIQDLNLIFSTKSNCPKPVRLYS